MNVEFNKVTWYSKIISSIVLLGFLPVLIFFIGREYQKTVSAYDKENGAAVTNFSDKDYVFSKRESIQTQKSYLSGVKGMATVGPTCPAEREGSEVECSDKPVSVVIKFINQFGAATTTTSTDNGLYKIMLPPGEYTILSGSQDIYPSLTAIKVVVLEDEYVTKDLSFDSGIR